MRLLVALALISLCLASAAEIDSKAEHYGKEAIVLSNGVLELTVLKTGATLAGLSLAEGDDVNPLWDSFRNDIRSGRAVRGTGATGHFLCADGFGPVSDQESAAGMRGHGEAHRLSWSTVETAADAEGARLIQAVQLPRVHETMTREITLREGEHVLRVHSVLESLLGFDRPVVWAEHATIGSPFLEAAKTVVDLSANRAMTRPRGKPAAGRKHRLVAGEEFDWPQAPTAGGGKVDLRAAPAEHDSLDHTGHLMTPSGPVAWVTALHPERNLLLGYLFKTSESPWLQTWENYPAQGMMARGLEFGTQAFDRPRREMVTQNRLFGEMLYRWLPARSKIESKFLMFWTPAPDGMVGVDEVELGEGRIQIRDKRSGKTLTLKTAQQL